MTVRIYNIFLATLLLLCGCESAETSFQPSNTISIAHLKSQLRGDSTPITEDYTVEGYVIGNDFCGEFYRSIIISDGSGGIEIAIDNKELYTQFPLFSHLTLHCSTLWLGDYGGRVILGEKPTGNYPVNHIGEGNIFRYIKPSDTFELFHPTEITIDAIVPQHIGNLFTLHDVTFAGQAGSKWCELDAEQEQYVDTYRLVYDRNGNTIPLLISRHATYASATIPGGWGSMVVIVEHFNGEYYLMLTNYQISF